MLDLISELFPFTRSITGPGVRETLEVLKRVIPLTVHEVPTGTQALDWTVPREWTIREAWIKDPSGRRIVDIATTNLHVLGYSVPVHATMSMDELRPHLHTLPDRPTWIPYRTSYYDEAWGFCLSHDQLMSMGDGPFEVLIDSDLQAGNLTYGELVLPGEIADEILVSTHVCHPSMANDNLSGIAVATFLAAELENAPRRHTIRFLFVPGTIGSLTWLALHDGDLKIRHGLALAGVGDAGNLTYKRTRRGTADVDRAAAVAFRDIGTEHAIRDFSPWGYDERQFNSPGFNLPVGLLGRTPHGTYPEYHTSADDLDFVRAASLEGSLEACRVDRRHPRGQSRLPKSQPEGRAGPRPAGPVRADRRLHGTTGPHGDALGPEPVRRSPHAARRRRALRLAIRSRGRRCPRARARRAPRRAVPRRSGRRGRGRPGAAGGSVSPPRIIAFAYACEPGEGSESGAGWIHARMLAGLGETWVLTRAVPPDSGSQWPHGLRDGEGYDAWLHDLPEEGRLRFVHVQIPFWDAFWWNRPSRPGFTRLQRVEYFVWLWLALRAARRLMRSRQFDAGWHLTWANAWLGSTLPLTGLPFVYGPVGGGVAPPWRLAASLGPGALAHELLRQVVRSTFRYLNPLGWLATRRASLILVQNPETHRWLPRSTAAKTVVLPNAVVTQIKRRPPKQPSVPHTALFAGRLDGFKGASFAIRTMVLLPEWRLLIVGEGPAEARLRSLVVELELTDRVEFLGYIPRVDLLEVMREQTDLLLFPSLHEEAGFVVAEAIATGIPVVCLDWGGPPVLGGIGVKPGSLARTVRELAKAVRATPLGQPLPPAPTLESRRAELAELVRRFGVFEPDLASDPADQERTSASR